MIDPDLPRLLEEAGIATPDQAARLHALLSRELKRDVGLPGGAENHGLGPYRGPDEVSSPDAP
jgi:hypothetical protein